MKKAFLTLGFVFLLSLGAFAQRFGYVDSEYILKHVPDYISAQKELSTLSAQWQKDIDDRFQEIEHLYKAFQADQVLMTADMKKRREAEIVDKEKIAHDLQKAKFGPDGELAQRSSLLIKPIQERIAKAIQAVAEADDLDMILDKNNQATMLFASPRLDKSADVITKLGLKPGVFAK